MSEVRRRRASRGSGEQLHDEIISAATELIVEADSLQAPSIREVARKIGVTPPSIYLHFANKNELVDAVCRRYFQRLDDEMTEAARDQPTALERMRALGMAYVRFAVRSPLMYQLATSAPRRGDAKLDEALASAAFTRLHRGVKELIDEGYYLEGNSEVTALQLWATAHGTASLLVTRPYLPWGDEEAFADGVLTAACLGQAVRGIDLAGLLPRQK